MDVSAAVRRAAGRSLALAAFALVLHACTAPGTPRPQSAAVPPATATPPAATTFPTAQGDYTVDAGDSKLRVRVYRAGTLAAFGHNHVVVAPLAGSARLDGTHVATLDVASALATWVVDDPAERARAGEGFESVPDAAAVAGTRANMFSAALLDAAQHPTLRIEGSGALIAANRIALDLRITIAGRTVALPVELEVVADGASWLARGTRRVDHATLGLVPFSALGGALSVADEIDIEVALRLRPAAE